MFSDVSRLYYACCHRRHYNTVFKYLLYNQRAFLLSQIQICNKMPHYPFHVAEQDSAQTAHLMARKKKQKRLSSCSFLDGKP